MTLPEKFKRFFYSDSFWAGMLRDALFFLTAAAIFISVSHILFGQAIPMVAVESESMFPNIHKGDIIFTESINRTEIITQEDGKNTGYISFDGYGDVILYRPYGRDGGSPIIHRAIYYVEYGEPMWKGGPSAPHAGYITKGDNPKTNPSYDQQGSISYMQPVKKEWVISVARIARVPLLGCITLTAKGNFACFK